LRPSLPVAPAGRGPHPARRLSYTSPPPAAPPSDDGGAEGPRTTHERPRELRPKSPSSHRWWRAPRARTPEADRPPGVTRARKVDLVAEYAHWFYIGGVAVLLVVMAMRRNVIVPAVVATAITA